MVDLLNLAWLARFSASMNELSGDGLAVLRKEGKFRASAEDRGEDEWARINKDCWGY